MGLVLIPMSSHIDKLPVIVAPKLIKIPIWCYNNLHVYRICALFSPENSQPVQHSMLNLTFNKAKRFPKGVTC